MDDYVGHVHRLEPVRVEQYLPWWSFGSSWRTYVYFACTGNRCAETRRENKKGIWEPETFGLTRDDLTFGLTRDDLTIR